MVLKKLIILMSILFSSGSLADQNNILLVRHGEGEHNVQGFHNSNMEHQNYRVSNLTDLGRKQIKDTAEAFKAAGFNCDNIDLVLVSPLPRTVQTAQVLLQEGVISVDKIKLEPRLIEVQAGDLEGLQHEKGKDHWDHSDGHKHGGETEQDVNARVSLLLAEMKSKYSNKNIAMVSHGTPSSEIIKIIKKKDSRTKMKNGELLILRI